MHRITLHLLSALAGFCFSLSADGELSQSPAAPTEADDGIEWAVETYDEDYAEVYDELWYEPEKYQFEISEIEATIPEPTSFARILDAGCGTGIHYALLSRRYDVTCMDISAGMLKVAEFKSPGGKFVQGDMNDRSLFEPRIFTHIMSMYAATLYNRDLQKVIENYHHWLDHRGALIISTLDPEQLYINAAPADRSVYEETDDDTVANGVIARTRYTGLETLTWWQVFPDTTKAIYHEKIIHDDGLVEKRDHTMWLPEVDEVQRIIEDVGFELIRRQPVLDDYGEVLFIFKKKRRLPPGIIRPPR